MLEVDCELVKIETGQEMDVLSPRVLIEVLLLCRLEVYSRLRFP